ncbi:MAG: alpha/beta fold hydrolase, partial [Acidobacteria bacterium]|nr:alpha/beta fold hydrolase [Acidobacteriota bacterium]
MLAFDPDARANSAVRTEDGASLFYWAAGDGPRTLLFVHGWGGSGSGRFWAPLLQHLDLSGIRLIAADLRGHGRSDKIRAGFTTETFARDMFA